MRSFFTTPRDTQTGLKLLHRNLYTAGHDASIPDRACRACSEKETQLHLCECDIIYREYWEALIQLAVDTGMTPPARVTAFIATGALSTTEAIPATHAGIWFLGWRCLYAELVRSRIDNTPPDLERALKRAVGMIIGRLRAYGSRWRLWVETGRYLTPPRAIPRKHHNKGVLTSDAQGNYTIHDAIWQLAQSLGIPTR